MAGGCWGAAVEITRPPFLCREGRPRQQPPAFFSLWPWERARGRPESGHRRFLLMVRKTWLGSSTRSASAGARLWTLLQELLNRAARGRAGPGSAHGGATQPLAVPARTLDRLVSEGTRCRQPQRTLCLLHRLLSPSSQVDLLARDDVESCGIPTSNITLALRLCSPR